MDKETKARLGEIRDALKKYGFDEILGQTAKSKIRRKDDDESEETSLLLDDEIPVKLRMMLQELGTTFIKLGQLLSTRPDIIGEKVSNELANLQDDNPPISYEQVKAIIERELDGNIDELFKEFKHEHLATASIGQVHEAILPDGERVAVKVQKEGITDKIDLDIRIMKYIANHADRLNKLKNLNLPGIMEEFDRSIHKEIDYYNEYMNMQRIEMNFIDNPGIHIPSTYGNYCTTKVLTMEFIDGTKLNDVYESDSEEFDKPLLAKNVLDSYLQQLFIDGFFHGDPHPGNMMILEDNVICYLDLGMMGVFEDDFKKNLCEAMILIVDQDIDGLINQMMYMDILDYDIDTKPLKRDLNDLFGRYFGVELNRFDGILEELMKLMKEYGVVLPNELVTMARGISMVEAIAHNLDPEIDIFASVIPVVKRIARERVNPKKYLKSKKSNIILYEHMLQALPKLLTRTIHKIDNEELQFRLEVDINDKVTIVALICALLIGSSVVSFGPMVFDMPLISLIGYLIAIVLSIIGLRKFVLV